MLIDLYDVLFLCRFVYIFDNDDLENISLKYRNTIFQRLNKKLRSACMFQSWSQLRSRSREEKGVPSAAMWSAPSHAWVSGGEGRRVLLQTPPRSTLLPLR